MALFNSSRFHLAEALGRFAADTEPGMRVLDAGAGDQPYAGLFSHTRYESADFEKVDKPYARSTHVCDLRAIPVEDARFDRIVFSQVMEHLDDPAATLAELRRVLKPGGLLFCSCPLYYEEHEAPYDFYRYTQYAHRHLFGQAGFEIERLDWLEGYLGTVAYQLKQMARDLPLLPPRGAPLSALLLWPAVVACKAAALPLTLALSRLDAMAKITGRGHPKNYLVLARAA